MTVVVGSDHRGVLIKQHILNLLRGKGIAAEDLGTNSEESVDYPDIAASVARAVATKKADRGILVCGTGLGMAIAANKIPGVRATAVHDEVTAELSRSHNDSNVLCLSADLLGERIVDHIVNIWMDTNFNGGRHARRLEKIAAIEKNPLP
jgi:ribose 5-phosphate isomerase B